MKTNIRFAFLLSGGIDSAVAMAQVLNQIPAAMAKARKRSEIPTNFKVEERCIAISIKYPSRHNRLEREASEKIAAYYGIPRLVIDATSLFSGNSALLWSGPPIPEGAYTDESMRKTVVPLRNGVFLMLAAVRAMDYWDNDDQVCLIIGAHSGDRVIYPDCRESFLIPMGYALCTGSDNRINLTAPLIADDKTAIVRKALKLNVPLVLTRTCYSDREKPCGKCGACNERAEAFAANNITEDQLR